MLASAQPRAIPKAERFDRPVRVRDGLLFLLHSPARCAGLLSLSPSGTSPYHTIQTCKLMRWGGRRFGSKKPSAPL
jgi:hypothetical protein